MRRIAAAAAALLFTAFVLASSALAQFADQGTGPFNASGSTNAYVITVPNATQYSDLTGVLLKWLPNAPNTGSATLQVNGNSGALSGSAPTLKKTSGSGLTNLTGGSPAELQTNQPVVVMLDASGNFDIVSAISASPAVSAANLLNSALSWSAPPNLAILASVSANQLTIAACTSGSTPPTCNAPSATNPIPIVFRDPTVANGDPIVASITAAQSLTIGSGNTMGCVSGQMCRITAYEINNGGTLGICAYVALSGTSIVGLSEAALQTSQSGTSGGSTAQDLYCNISAVASKAVREIGYVDIQETTAGTWATGPTNVQLFGPGVPRPGEVVQGPLFTTSSATASITPLAAADLIEVTTSGTVTASATNTGAATLPGITFKQGAATLQALAQSGYEQNGTAYGITYQLSRVLTITNSVSPVTYSQTATTSGSFGAPSLSQVFFNLTEISP